MLEHTDPGLISLIVAGPVRSGMRSETTVKFNSDICCLHFVLRSVNQKQHPSTQPVAGGQSRNWRYGLGMEYFLDFVYSGILFVLFGTANWLHVEELNSEVCGTHK